LRQHWPRTHILLRGDGHFSNPELMQLILDDGNCKDARYLAQICTRFGTINTLNFVKNSNSC